MSTVSTKTDPIDGEALCDELEAMFSPVAEPERKLVKKKVQIPFSGGRRLATAQEAGVYLGMTTRQVVAAVKRGDLKSIKGLASNPTGRMRFTKAELDRFRQSSPGSSTESLPSITG